MFIPRITTSLASTPLAFLLTLLMASSSGFGRSLPAHLRPGVPSRPGPDALARAGAYDRKLALTSFANAYYPGRSGQLVFISRPGVVFTLPGAPFNHGSFWEYDTRVPFVLYGPGQVRPGSMDHAVARPYDIPPTLVAALGMPRPVTMIGRAWSEVLESEREPLRALLIVVMDQVGFQDMQRFADFMPTLQRFRREGADFPSARLDYLPSFTAVSHAGVGTGAPPAVHGVCNNMLLEPGASRLKVVFRQPNAGADPAPLMAPTLADRLDITHGNRPVVLSQVYAEYAAVAMAGHGLSYEGGDRDTVVWFDKRRGVHTTDERFYGIPSYIAEKSVQGILDRFGAGLILTPKMTARIEEDPSYAFRTITATPWFARYEADNMLEMMAREGVGKDDAPDLVMVNLKSTDAFGHLHGHEHFGYRACMREVDRFLSAAERLLKLRAGEGRYMIAVTADHGCAPNDAARRYNKDLAKWLGDSLDALGDQDGVSSVIAVDGYQVYLNMEELDEEGHTLDDARQILSMDPDLLEVWTTDEVQRRHGELFPVSAAASQ